MAPTARSSKSPTSRRSATRRRRISGAAPTPAQGTVGLLYCRDASHRPLHGTPADAPFHFPHPALPLSWPFAYAPLMDTRTRPSRPILPETSAPGAEIFPSVTVSVERTDGSHVPALVMIVTFHNPS